MPKELVCLTIDKCHRTWAEDHTPDHIALLHPCLQARPCLRLSNLCRPPTANTAFAYASLHRSSILPKPTKVLNSPDSQACALGECDVCTKTRAGHTLQAGLMLGSSGKAKGRLTMLSKVCSLRAPRKGERPYTSSCRRMPKDHQSTGAPEKHGRQNSLKRR